MHNKSYKEGLIIAIIMLVIGVVINPAFAVEIKSTIVNKDSYKICGCEAVGKYNLITEIRFLNRLEVYTKLLLVSFKYNPKVADNCKDILEIIKLDNTLGFPNICGVLKGLELPLTAMYIFLLNLDAFLIRIDLSFIIEIYKGLLDFIAWLWESLDCWIYFP